MPYAGFRTWLECSGHLPSGAFCRRKEAAMRHKDRRILFGIPFWLKGPDSGNGLGLNLLLFNSERALSGWSDAPQKSAFFTVRNMGAPCRKAKPFPPGSLQRSREPEPSGYSLRYENKGTPVTFSVCTDAVFQVSLCSPSCLRKEKHKRNRKMAAAVPARGILTPPLGLCFWLWAVKKLAPTSGK